MKKLIESGDAVSLSRNLLSGKENEYVSYSLIVHKKDGSHKWIDIARMNHPLSKFNAKSEVNDDPDAHELAKQVEHALERETSLCKAKSYTLQTEDGFWLAQVVLTSDGMFSCVSDWGNFSFAWRNGGTDFREFLISLNVDYFANKMAIGLSYYTRGKSIDKACEKFAEMVLPKLQEVLREELKLNTRW